MVKISKIIYFFFTNIKKRILKKKKKEATVLLLDARAQAQRDFFGSHTYERIDKPGWFHTVWDPRNSADSITTSSYNN